MGLEHLFDQERFLAEQVAEDAAPFMQRFIATQLFSVFFQTRAEQRVCDLFDRWSFLKMHLKAARLSLLRQLRLSGYMYKAQRGTRHGWKRRFFVLTGMRIDYYRPNKQLEQLEAELRATAEQGGDYTRVLKHAMDARRSCLRSTFHLVPGLTQVSIPGRTRQLWSRYKTQFVLELLNPERKGQAADSLCLCAESSEQRSAWVALIRARLHDPSSVRELAEVYLYGRPAALLVGRVKDYRSIARETSVTFSRAMFMRQGGQGGT